MVSSDPNKKIIRVGIAGLGLAGTLMIRPFLDHPNTEITAAADLDRDVVDRFARDFNVKGFYDVESMCKSEDIDAIYISTPTQFHVQHTIAAAEHKKHIILEKPIATSMDDTDKIIQAVESNGICLVVGHVHSSEQPILKMREIIESKELGSLKMINSMYYNDWIYRPRLPDELDASISGGMLLNQGFHQFDIIRTLGGGLVKKVIASIGHVDHLGTNVGSYNAFLEFENGASAAAIYSGCHHFPSSELTFDIGELGEINTHSLTTKESHEKQPLKTKYNGIDHLRNLTTAPFQPFFGLTIVSCEHGDIRQSSNGLFIYSHGEKKEVLLEKGVHGRMEIINELIHGFYDEKKPLHDIHWGKATMEVCLAVNESAKERREVYLFNQVKSNSFCSQKN